MVRHVIIIGAGPSGLVALKTLLGTGNYTCSLIESSHEIGGTFATKTYDDGALVSSRLLTAFSDFRFQGKASTKDHPSIPEYLEYLKQYADHFQLWSHIRFGTRVDTVQRESNGGYVVTISPTTTTAARTTTDLSDSILRADAVCVCSGLHNVSRIPHIQSLHHKFTGSFLHSSEYKERAMFKGQRVLVVGAGETGCDIAYRAAIARADAVLLSARSGFLSVPHEWYKGAPLDSFITNLFECCYQHRYLERFKLKWRCTTPFIRLGFLFGSGTSSGWNQWALTKTTFVARGHHIINKSVKAMAYINRPLKKKSLLGRWIYSYLDEETDPMAPDIDTTYATPVSCEGGKNIKMSDGTVREFDTIVFCTGYKQKFPFLSGGGRAGGAAAAAAAAAANKDEVSSDDDDNDIDDPLPDLHNIVSRDTPDLSFIGFVRPNVGAIPPMSEIQVMWWIQHMEGKLLPLKYSPTYHLLGNNARTGSYAVDYGAYMSDLAREMGALPDLIHWFCTSPKVAMGYALGQSYPTYFRLSGPFQCTQARKIAETELWEPVWRRPFVTNVVFVSVCVVFGYLNMICVVLEILLTPLNCMLNICSKKKTEGKKFK